MPSKSAFADEPILAATARRLDLTLLTADERLLGAREFAVLPNR